MEFIIEHLDPRTLTPHPENWRRHPKAQRTALEAAIAEHGWLAAPIWNRRTGHLLDGHARVEVAVTEETEAIPVRVIDVPVSQEKRILASFDRIGELRERDDDALAALLQELSETPEGLPAGWEAKDLEELLGEAAGENGLQEGADPDAIPEQVETRCQPGDLWELGHHRLLCGDSTAAANVERLLGKIDVPLLFTSPPYLQQREYEDGVGDWDALMQGVFSNAPGGDCQVLVNLGLVHRDGEWLPYWDNWIEWMRGQGWRRFGFYVWDQGFGMPGDWAGRFAPSHEFIFHFNRAARKPHKTLECKRAGERHSGGGMRQADGRVGAWSHVGRTIQDTKIPDSVVRVTRHAARGIECKHPAVFPVALATAISDAFTAPGDAVYDPFGGSGTTLIACEQTGRTARLMELSPAYCDVILARWEQTGRTAKRIEADG